MKKYSHFIPLEALPSNFSSLLMNSLIINNYFWCFIFQLTIFYQQLLYNFDFIVFTKYMKRPQSNNLSQTIQEFNRQCAQEKTKRSSNITKRYQKRIQNYGIDMASKIGEGTFSKVYKGKDMVKDIQVAVKIVELRKIEEMGIEDLFWQEINIIRRLRHPNIVSCTEYFKTTNNCYTIYELCEGGDLSNKLRKGHLGEKEDISYANAIIKDVFQGLLYLQSMSIVHRDIKAANILLAGGKAKIGDFGFATHCKKEFKDVSIGSPAYMAPQGLIHNIYGPKTDVWSFGMLLFQILHGKTPYHNCESQVELKQRVQVPVNWDQLKSNLSSPLKRLILKCLKVDYQQRPTFNQLLNDEYIQKIYQEGCSRHIFKSNYTKITSDSQASATHILPRSCQRQPRTPITPKQQRFATEECEIDEDNQNIKLQPHNIKTESNQISEDLTKNNLLQSINMSELIELVNKNSAETQIPKDIGNIQKEVIHNPLKEASLQKFLILSQEPYSQQQLESYLSVVKIFRESIYYIEGIQKKVHPEYFIQFTNQLLLEIYLKSQSLVFARLIEQIENNKDLLSAYSKANIIFVSQPRLIYRQIDEELFGLIKLTETAIDRQGIEGHTEQQGNEENKLVYTGNILIIALQLIYSIQSSQSTSQWISNFNSKLHSSEQFFIWLYQLQLKRMDRSEQ